MIIMKNTNRGKQDNQHQPGNAGFRTPAVFKVQKSGGPNNQNFKPNFNANFANQKRRIPRSK